MSPRHSRATAGTVADADARRGVGLRDDDRMTEGPDLIADAAAVTPEWLTGVLRASGAAPPPAEVVSFDTESIGTGKLGENVRFSLSWDGADDAAVPASVVGKFASGDPTSRQAGLLTGTYVREVSFYQELADRVEMRVPRCHLARLDGQSGEFVLVFEDISPAHAGDQITGCTVDEAALAMEELALLHAGLWDDPALQGRGWLVTRRADGGQSLAAIYDALVGGFLAQYDDRLSDTARSAAEAFTGQVADWISGDEGPFTLLHGDYRLENMLFGDGPGASPLTVVDWQTPNVGPGPSDAAYFLGAGLPTELRRSHERELLEVYRQGLTVKGVELSAEDCWDRYRANTLAGLHMTVVASVLVGREERSDEMFLTMAERHAAHVIDLDALREL